MEPLTDDEKRAIVRLYRELETAIQQGANVAVRFSAFQNAYRGDSQTLVGDFRRATDKRKWVAELGRHLRDEIESEFWSTSVSEPG